MMFSKIKKSRDENETGSVADIDHEKFVAKSYTTSDRVVVKTDHVIGYRLNDLAFAPRII